MDNSWKVYAMNDCDWYVARTPEEAVEAMRENMGYKNVDDLKGDGMLDDQPTELSADDLDGHYFHLDESKSGPTITFRAQLDRMIAEGKGLPGFFASTEF